MTTPKFMHLKNLDLSFFMFLPSKGYLPLAGLALNSLRKLFSGSSSEPDAIHTTVITKGSFLL